jgi:hypothetical protein
MQRMPAQAGAVLFDFHLLCATGDFNFGAVIQVTGLGALKPYVLAAFFSHDTPLKRLWIVESRLSKGTETSSTINNQQSTINIQP